MKKYICSILSIFIMSALLCSCASRENTAAVYGTGKPSVEKLPINHTSRDDIGEELTAAVSESTEPAAEDTVEVSPETEETEETAPESAETAAPETAESFEPEETEEPEEGLDTFYIDEYGAYKLTRAERGFTKESVFVGDSICSGFSVYNTVYPENVLARGSLAAWSFFDYNFYVGDREVDYPTALALTKPKYAFLSMGMNDVNMFGEEEYCENYRAVIDATLASSEAEVYVCAISPIIAESMFTTNYRIDCFNVALKSFIEENYSERVHFLDFAKHLKDSDDSLKDCFDGGDGIHLSPYAYYVALWEMNRSMIADGVK